MNIRTLAVLAALFLVACGDQKAAQNTSVEMDEVIFSDSNGHQEENKVLINGKFFNASEHEDLIESLTNSNSINHGEAIALVKIAAAITPDSDELPKESIAMLGKSYSKGELTLPIITLSKHIKKRKSVEKASKLKERPE